MTNPPFNNRAPVNDRITAYDERHFVTYSRLLDAAEEGAEWRDVASVILGLDADVDSDRARAVHDSRLERARWLTEQGYNQLLEKTCSPCLE